MNKPLVQRPLDFEFQQEKSIYRRAAETLRKKEETLLMFSAPQRLRGSKRPYHL
jgi:hypothetical protein